MKTFFKNKYFLLICALIFFSAGAFLYDTFSGGAAPTIKGFENVLHKKEKRLSEEMLALAKRAETATYDQLFSTNPSYYSSLMKEEGVALLIYENDTLKFWSDNSIAVENWVKEVCLDQRMAKLHNGWFEVVRPHTNATTTKAIVGLVLVKNEYPYQNKYLVNEFQKDFAVPAETKLITDNPNASNGVKNYTGEYLFSLEFNPANNSVSLSSYIAVLFSLLGFIFLIAFLKRLTAHAFARFGRNYSCIFFILFVIILRFSSIKFSFPEIFYSFDLFSPQVFANANSIWLASLGDLLINIILLFYLTYTFLNDCEFNSLVNRLQKLNKLVLSFCFFLAFFWFSWAISDLFIGLIKNSNIPFGINNLFTLNQYSFVGIIIIGLLLFVYFLFADKMVSVLKQLKLNNKQYVFVFIISAATHTLMSHLLGTLDVIVILWPFLLVLSIALVKNKQVIYPFSSIIFLVFLFSLYAVHIFIKHSGIKEVESRKIYAEKLAAEQDPVAEMLFKDVEKKLKADTLLLSLVSGPEKQPEEFEKRVRQQYFSGFWEKYDVHVALFDSACAPIIRSQNPLFDNNFYFDELIEKRGRETSCEGFSFINNSSGKISYLAKIPLFRNSSPASRYGTIYIELDAKFISDEVGFPELLLDRNIGLSQELGNYSYAKYKHNQLMNQYGKYSYNLTAADFRSVSQGFAFQDTEGFNHLLYRPDTETLIVLS
ncbi:MAG: hypothetical protein H0X46_01455, partial [Bacteroidetes bacterium]|nr:hypothetical protein [Bacteroidota bacterium]